MLVSLFAPLFLLQNPTLPPKVGDRAPAFVVRTPTGEEVRLPPLLKKGPVALIVLRGYPGYQCPLCTIQVGELIERSDEFAKRKTTVVLVYPGPANNLKERADEFVKDKGLPKAFRLVLDPDYRFTESYGLRWSAANETAYPSTFVIGRDGRVAYAKVSRTHGDRAPLPDVLAALDKMVK